MPLTINLIQAVWDKAATVEKKDPKHYRKDVAGAIICRSDYAKESSEGWEIDFIYPESMGGTDDLLNLRPMQWKNKKAKKNNYPHYSTTISSEFGRNIDKNQAFTVNKTLQEQLKYLYKLSVE